MDTPYKIIAFTSHDEYIMVMLNDIIYLKSAGNYSRVLLNEEKELVLSKNLKEVENLLPKDQFIRTHKQYLVNKYHVFKFLKQESLVVLKNEEKLPVAVRRKQNLLSAFHLV